MLTKSIYFDWAALIHVMLQARGLWIAVSLGSDDLVEDRMALEVISKASPPPPGAYMMGTMRTRQLPRLRGSWDAIRQMHIGVERVCKAKTNTLGREFESLKFRDGETTDDLGIRINSIANQLTILGSGCMEEEFVRKILQVLPTRYM